MAALVFADLGSWLAARAGEFWSLSAAIKVSLLQTVLGALAGSWVLWLYLRRREGQSTLRVDGAYRVVRRGDDRLVFVRLHVMNSAAVRAHRVEATISVLHASLDEQSGQIVFQTIRRDDPLLPATGDIRDVDNGLTAFTSASGDLEPNECVQTEVLFRVPPEADVLALRLTVTATSLRTRLLRKAYTWGWFGFLDTEAVTDLYRPLSLHTAEDAHS